jgi:hypothetical protein
VISVSKIKEERFETDEDKVGEDEVADIQSTS